MIFNSVSYLLFFPIVTILYFAFPKKLRNAWLLIASYFFYMNWNAAYGLLLFGSTMITYLCSLLVEWAKEKKQSVRLAKAAMAASFLLNLGLLFYFKYLNFAIVNLNRISSLFHGRQISAFDILLPVGISFYIFQALGYTMDVYRGKIKACRNFFRYALFVSFFPQLVAGPIERSDNLLPQFEEEHTFDTDRIREGLLWMLWGLFLKIVIADNLSVYITEIYDNYLAYTGAEIVFATVLFAFQIYCDFGGYSYIAIGSAKVLGFRLMDNFKAPYLAVSVHDFWRRWHISLSSWFREYVYIPLGGNRKGLARQLFNIMVVWMLTGLWHGANWNFVLWGVYYGVLLMIEKLFLLKWLDKLPNWIGHIYSMFLVVIGWTIFAQTDIRQLGGYLKTMFGIGHVAVADSDFLYFLGSNAVLLVALIAASIDYRVWMRRLKLGKDATVYDAIATSKGWTIAKPVLMVVFLLVSFAFLVGDSYNPFLYFRF